MDSTRQAWQIVGAINSPYNARKAYNYIAHMDGIDPYTFVKLTQAIGEQFKRYRDKG